MEKIEVLPGLWLSRALADHWPQIEATRRTAIKITATPVDTPGNRPSSFGCYPTLPRGFTFPTDEAGDYLCPIAQIHCKESPPLAGYPDTGYLQFYIADSDDLYGLDFDDPVTQKNFRVLYFEEEQVSDPETDFGFLDEIFDSRESPVSKPHALNFSLQQDYIGMSEFDSPARVALAVALKEKYPDLYSGLEDELYQAFRSNGHKIGGYAYFTQTDPREYKEGYRDWITLFQMDTDKAIMWGDAGVANFFIHPDRLCAKDFSTVLYNWDCC